MISRRLMLSTLIGSMVVGATPLLANAPKSSLRPAPRPDGSQTQDASSAMPPVKTEPLTIEQLLAQAKLGKAISGFVVLDADSGQILESHEPDATLPPASVAKTVTSLFALDRLGPQFRYRTRVVITGPIEAGMVQGDLILCGDGDPTLQTDQLGDLVAAMSAQGIIGITGNYLLWGGSLPNLREISDEQPAQVGYNPAISGLNLNYNRVNFEWKRKAAGEWTTTMDARGDRFMPLVKKIRMKVVDRAAPIFTYNEEPLTEDWSVAASALGKGGSRWLPVRQPARYAGEVFRTLAEARGIRLPDAQAAKAVPAGQEVAAVESAPLADILREMLRYSTNLTAEAVGLRASGAVTLEASGKAMTDWLRVRFGVTSEWHDHSGLGSKSRVTARDMAKILLEARQAGLGLEPILRNQGSRDAKGKEIPNSPIRIAAKTGTLNYVSGLAGYVLPPQGRALVFAIASADTAKRDLLSMDERESPPGGDAWLGRARNLQQQLLRRWEAVYLQQS